MNTNTKETLITELKKNEVENYAVVFDFWDLTIVEIDELKKVKLRIGYYFSDKLSEYNSIEIGPFERSNIYIFGDQKEKKTITKLRDDLANRHYDSFLSAAAKILRKNR